MSAPILIKTYTEPPIDRREILRYAGCKEADAAVTALLEDCLQEAKKELSYRVCYQVAPLKIEGNRCDFGGFSVCSKKLAQNLAGCREAVLFAATIGVGIDRLIGKNLRIAPAKAMMLDAIGTERIESLCDAFCRELGICRPRFSPGYGDLKLEVQKELIARLDCLRKINLCLTDHFLMTPSKSVTAFVGLGAGEERSEKCSQCSKKDCEFRRS